MSNSGKDTCGIQRQGKYSLYVLVPAEFARKNNLSEISFMDAWWIDDKITYKPVSLKEIKNNVG